MKRGFLPTKLKKKIMFICFKSNNAKLTDSEIDDHILEINKDSETSDDFKARQYKHDREKLYPSIQDCIHALLDGGDTLTELQAKRQEVKKQFPKSN